MNEEEYKKRWSTGGFPYHNDDAYWRGFCIDCCYRLDDFCGQSGLPAGMENKKFLPAFDACGLWPLVKKKILEKKKVFKYTFEGSMRVRYSFQENLSRTRDPVRYGMHYTYEEFREKLIELGYKAVCLRWARSGFKESLRPVVKRRRKKEGYTIDNICLGG